jgi:hypothetical protein
MRLLFSKALWVYAASYGIQRPSSPEERAALASLHGTGLAILPPSVEEVEWATAHLADGFKALIVACAKTGTMPPPKNGDEDEKTYFSRIQFFGRHAHKLFKEAILKEADFKVPTYVTISIADDAGWQDSSCLQDSPLHVPGRQRVVIATTLLTKKGPCDFILFDRATDPGERIDIDKVTVPGGTVSKVTIGKSGWFLRAGWRRGGRNTPPRRNDDQTGSINSSNTFNPRKTQVMTLSSGGTGLPPAPPAVAPPPRGRFTCPCGTR